jgi:hypothetical protein
MVFKDVSLLQVMSGRAHMLLSREEVEEPRLRKLIFGADKRSNIYLKRKSGLRQNAC